jgi:ElaB/YqjD/DUF883 family membrane-anchored ribosome-binding protein
MIVKTGRLDGRGADVAAALVALRADVRRIADDCERLARNRRGAAEAAISDAVDGVKSQVSQFAGDLDVFSSYFEAELGDRIRARPLAAIAIAAGAGYVLRSLRARRRH